MKFISFKTKLLHLVACHLHSYRLEACPVCNNSDVTFLNDDPRVIQQVEIKEVLVVKSEHRSYPYWCEKCKNSTTTNSPHTS